VAVQKSAAAEPVLVVMETLLHADAGDLQEGVSAPDDDLVASVRSTASNRRHS